MSNLKPDAVFDGLQHIDLEFLKGHHIKGILLDIDNTLFDMSYYLSEDIINWVKSAKEKGFSILVLSNTYHKEKFEIIKSNLDIEIISFAKKPSKSGFLRAAKQMKLKNDEIAMIGDQIFTDVVGANRVGMFSIYVKPINKKEYWYTAWKRPIEKMILKHYGYKFTG
jgi:HAD superfamily phosphatase (TIGR01668 family)